MSDKPARRIIWHDPNINSKENATYFKEYFQDVEIERFENYENAMNFLLEAPGTWIVITSGRNGYKFVELIHDLNNIKGIILFCRDPARHEKWTQPYNKIFKIVDYIKDVQTAVQALFDKIFVRELLEATGEPVPHSDYTQAISSFKYTARLLMEKKACSSDKILDELLLLNPLVKSELKKDFEKRRTDPFRAIVNLYSTNYLHKYFNKKLAAQKYHKLRYTLATLVQGIKARPDSQIDKKTILYRSSRNRDQEEIYNVDGKTMFWPGFVSTGQDLKDAEKAAGPRGVIFAIKMSAVNPHPFIKLNTGSLLSSSEIHLLPHFAFKVKSKEASGERVLIYVEQDEEDYFISLDDAKFTEYWRKIINSHVMPKVQWVFMGLDSIIYKFDLCRYALTWWEPFVVNRFQEQIRRGEEMGEKSLAEVKRSVAKIMLNSAAPMAAESIVSHFLDKEIENLVICVGFTEDFCKECRIFIKNNLCCWKAEIINLHVVKPVLEKYIEILIEKLQGGSETLSKEEIKIMQEDVLEKQQTEWEAINGYARARMKSKLEELKPEIYRRMEEYWYQG